VKVNLTTLSTGGKQKPENKNQKTSLPITAAKQGNKQTLLFWICKNINIPQAGHGPWDMGHTSFWKMKG